MEFTVSSAQLLKGTLDVSKAIPVKTGYPILENFLFNLKSDGLEITASDQELTLRTVVAVENIKEEGAMAVPAKQLLELLKSLPDQPVTFKVSTEEKFECIWSNGNSTLPYFNAGDFPEIKGIGADAQTVTITGEELLEGIGHTVYATAEDEMRPAMNGIFFDIDTDSTTMVASDSHKLICYTTKEMKSAEKTSFILHKKPALILKGIVSKDCEEVSISFDGNGMMFKWDNTMMLCRIIVGKYPKYREVIPQNNANILRIDREQLLNTVRRVAVCANKASNRIKFELKPGQLEITAQDLGFALAAYEKLECDYSGAALEIGFKSSFLIDILSNLGCTNVVMKFADGKRAALIVPSEDEAESEKACGILMPIMIS